MSTAGVPSFTPDWLALREGADAAARATELLDRLREHLAARPRPGEGLVIRDLGCGTGSMGRWLAGRLRGPQHWILHDRDPELLAHARTSMSGQVAADGGLVTAGTREGDLTGLRPPDLAGTSLVTASALLDLLTSDEVDALAAACVETGCPALLALSVMGRVELTPADPLDAEIAAAFNAHQRRTVGGRRLLGPDAAGAAVAAFTRRGAVVRSSPSAWRLDADQTALMGQWLQGWVGAAREHRPELALQEGTYLRRRLDACSAGELRVVVHHSDLLALPVAPVGGVAA